MFRGPTSRGNIRYQVHQVEGETVVKAISQVVKEKLEQYPAPSKIVVYGGSVDQTIKVGEALGCPIYHRNVDSRAGKAQRMYGWSAVRVQNAVNFLSEAWPPRP